MRDQLRIGRVAARALVVALAGCAGLSAGLNPTEAQAGVRWKVAPDAALAPMTRAQLAQAFAGVVDAARGEQSPRRFVMTFVRPVSEGERDALSRAGISLLNYLGDNAFFASIDPDRFNADDVLEIEPLETVRPIQRQWKQHPDIAAGLIRPWQVVGAPIKPGMAGEDVTVAVYVLLHADASLDGQGRDIVARHGGTIVSFLDSINGVVVELPASEVKSLTDEDAVMWVEPPLPLLAELNAENRARTQADLVNVAPYSLNGAGVTVMVYDGGRVFAHNDLAGRLTQGEPLSDGVSDHSTHVAGTIGGSGAGVLANRGMAPAVQIISYAFEVPGGLSQGFLYTNPGDLQDDYVAAIAAGADISNNSIGTNTEPNGYPCEWHGNYGVTDVLIDQIVRGTSGIGAGQPFRVVWAAGNERQGSRCDVEFPAPNQDYASTAPPGMAKNHISVGALNSNDDSMTTFSSWGPGDDGRMRPDISAPGCQSTGDGGVTSTSSSGGYNVKCGTSMASPTVCGIGALIMQDYRSRYPSRPEMRNSTLKTLLAHTAADLGNVGPDNQFGYGSVRVKDAVDFMRTDRHTEASISGQGGSQAYTVVVAPGDPQLKVTIAWDDVPGTPNVNPVLVNDLDLVVTSPSGARFYPWTLSGTQPWLPAVQTQRNSLDNIEQVLVNSPEAGAWRVEVVGTAVPQGPQPFSLAANPFLVNCSDQGTASLSPVVLNCSSLLNVSVGDCGLNTDDNAVETVTVNLASTSNPVGLSVVLTESAAQSADFRASVQLSTSPSSGELLVGNGDTVTLTYQDADSGSGSPATVTRTATVDCAGPVISGVAAQNVTSFSAQVVFTTSEPATTVLRYGTACGTFTQTLTDANPTLTHTFNLTGLTGSTIFFFDVQATDASGNSASDNNGGSCYSFTTAFRPDYFTELFSASDNDLDNRSIFFTPDGSTQFYRACEFPISALPNDPLGGTLIALPDDSPSTTLTLTGGQTIKLYGVSYSSFFLNPNGNISFSAGDSATGESIATHFNRARISILFDDLNATQGGSVRWQQLSDRVVITYLNVPKHNAGAANGNTFQYELFFDGRIGFHYLNLSITDGLAGLSRGSVTPPDFVESDLSAYAACGPRPPTAAGQNITLARGEERVITLLATDDGLPAPGNLRYTITSLPTNGWLTDPNGGPINAVPYQIPGGENAVRYQPRCSLNGTDAFNFIANDFGVAPDGGDSNPATIAFTVGGPSVVRSYLVDNTNPGWTFDAAWAFGQPTGGGGSAGGGSGSPDPTGGFTGTNVYGYNLAGNYPNNLTPARNLTSTAIDLSGFTNTKLRFQRWLGVEASQYDAASVQISTNGTTWNTVWAHSGASLNPGGTWTQVSYDIAQWADNQPTVYLRWVQGTTDGSVVYCGWNIDDIEILADIPAVPCQGDYNDDCDINFADITYVLGNWGTYNFSDITNVLGNYQQPCP